MALAAAGSSSFATVEELPPDKIFFTKRQFLNDESKVKYNLGIGAYRTKHGKPLVLDVVHKVERELAADMSLTKEYFPIGGDKEFIANAQRLILGSKAYDNIIAKRGIAGVQGLSGTGSLRLLFSLVKQSLAQKNDKLVVWLSDPTWGNHKKIVAHAGLPFETYPYWNPVTKGLNFQGLMETLNKKSKKGDIILLQACAHNPTGVDPTQEQWKEICKLVQTKGLIPLFDSAYQGFATGDLDNDAWAVQYFAEQGCELMIAQSFSKNLGLYNERIGCASVVVNSGKIANAISTQLCAIVRPMYSNPPSHGARIVNKVLGNQDNYKLWRKEMNGMSSQILQARLQLRWLLENKHGLGKAGKAGKAGSDESKDNNDGKGQTPWQHITDQIGMFCFSGLTVDQVTRMKMEHHTYLLDSGRISMAGVAPSDFFKVSIKQDGSLTKEDCPANGKNDKDAVSGNVEYIAQGIAEVVQWQDKQKSKM